MVTKNLFDGAPEGREEEIVETLLDHDGLKVERIISAGQATPPGIWYDQDRNEWVALLKGSAGLLFEGDADIQTMKEGDYVLIPAHRRHRVEWTDLTQTTIWLALHFSASTPGKT
jgi:cupin 2 domain-containing protein